MSQSRLTATSYLCFTPRFIHQTCYGFIRTTLICFHPGCTDICGIVTKFNAFKHAFGIVDFRGVWANYFCKMEKISHMDSGWLSYENMYVLTYENSVRANFYTEYQKSWYSSFVSLLGQCTECYCHNYQEWFFCHEITIESIQILSSIDWKVSISSRPGLYTNVCIYIAVKYNTTMHTSQQLRV